MPRVLGYHQSRVHSKNRLSFRRVWARFGAKGERETRWTRSNACSRSGPLERLRATGTRWLAACKVLRWFSTSQGEDQGPFFWDRPWFRFGMGCDSTWFAIPQAIDS